MYIKPRSFKEIRRFWWLPCLIYREETNIKGSFPVSYTRKLPVSPMLLSGREASEFILKAFRCTISRSFLLCWFLPSISNRKPVKPISFLQASRIDIPESRHYFTKLPSLNDREAPGNTQLHNSTIEINTQTISNLKFQTKIT